MQRCWPQFAVITSSLAYNVTRTMFCLQINLPDIFPDYPEREQLHPAEHPDRAAEKGPARHRCAHPFADDDRIGLLPLYVNDGRGYCRKPCRRQG